LASFAALPSRPQSRPQFWPATVMAHTILDLPTHPVLSLLSLEQKFLVFYHHSTQTGITPVRRDLLALYGQFANLRE